MTEEHTGRRKTLYACRMLYLLCRTFCKYCGNRFFCRAAILSLRRDCRAEPEGGCSGGSNSEKDI